MGDLDSYQPAWRRMRLVGMVVAPVLFPFVVAGLTAGFSLHTTTLTELGLALVCITAGMAIPLSFAGWWCGGIAARLTRRQPEFAWAMLLSLIVLFESSFVQMIIVLSWLAAQVGL